MGGSLKYDAARHQPGALHYVRHYLHAPKNLKPTTDDTDDTDKTLAKSAGHTDVSFDRCQ